MSADRDTGEGAPVGSVVALSHVGLLTNDIVRVIDDWDRLFGLRPLGLRPIWLASDEGVLATVIPVGDAGVEPLQPVGRETMQSRLLERGRRAFHLSLHVKDIHATASALRDAGVAVQLRRPGRIVPVHRGWIHETVGHGITIELIDTDEVAAFRGSGSQPAAIGTDSPVRDFIAVGHGVHDLEPAARLYSDALGLPALDKAPVTSADGVLLMQRFMPPRGPVIELVQPLISDSTVGRRLASFGEGMAYLRLGVTQFDELEQRLIDQEAWLRHDRTAGGDAPALWVDELTTHGIPVSLVAS